MFEYEYEHSRSLNEECGIFGVWGHEDANQIVYYGLHSLQHRGQEGAGIVTSQKADFHQYRGIGLLSQVFEDPNVLGTLKGNNGIGHVRYATCGGSEDLVNVQPFLFRFHDQNIAIAHNGNITNAKTLRKQLEQNGAVFHATSDSEVLIHLIRQSQAVGFEQKLAESLAQLRGGFNYVILTNDGLMGAVDRNAFRPLAIGQLSNGAYVLASETCALDTIGAKFVGNVHAGQYVVINNDGIRLEQYTHETQVAIEAMEYIYFARPDSDIAGINVHSVRKETGKVLARECPAPLADMVVGVPNSSLSAASGYAEESGLPYEMGLIKNQYVARTFIAPTQALREQGVRKKLSAVNSVVRGKSIVLVDDSIVRGTTCKRIVQLLREAGAKEIHLRIASPPFRFPNFYGIDMSTSGELLAANKTHSEMVEYLGCDSLGFLSVQGLIEGIGTQFNAPNKGLCISAFTGQYPADLCDYQAELESQLTLIQRQILNGENVDE
ncbi:amidophosphoribosyltransferase [Bibersteinia trehalosi]|uniref:amidophosphoribosyltransferase n=1 Tax=Bibersteinia trehalosi TaxID=47735 RepID=UPI002D7830CD|nr:amidophosphoribosyltransferase [Bibersteinia trehalosi]